VAVVLTRFRHLPAVLFLAPLIAALAGCASTDAPAAAPSSPTGPSTTCSYPTDGETPAKPVDPPAAQEPETGTATVELTMNGGVVTISMDRSAVPCTVGSFVHLAHAGYYTNTPCHRLTASPTLSVLQCGDPTGTGGGGPGYSFADETDPGMAYPAGTVAMANAGPDTNGSQFFLVHADSSLPPSYTVFGTVTGGMDVLTRIAQKGTDSGGPDGAPAEPVAISAVTVTD